MLQPTTSSERDRPRLPIQCQGSDSRRAVWPLPVMQMPQQPAFGPHLINRGVQSRLLRAVRMACSSCCCRSCGTVPWNIHSLQRMCRLRRPPPPAVAPPLTRCMDASSNCSMDRTRFSQLIFTPCCTPLPIGNTSSWPEAAVTWTTSSKFSALFLLLLLRSKLGEYSS